MNEAAVKHARRELAAALRCLYEHDTRYYAEAMVRVGYAMMHLQSVDPTGRTQQAALEFFANQAAAAQPPPDPVSDWCAG